MNRSNLGRSAIALCIATLLAGCASTTVEIQPSSQPAICAAAETALVLWAPRWRPDQKAVATREEAAAAGLRDFFASSGCFAQTELRKVAELSASSVRAQLAGVPVAYSKLVGIEVRELGPTVKLFSSASLVEGGTEVVLRVVEYSSQAAAEQRSFIVHWRNGGAGVVKGVASLPADLQAALRAGLLPAAAQANDGKLATASLRWP